MSPRVGIVGARRVRQGLGPFVATFLQRLGADVCGALCTGPENAAQAVDELGARGIETRAYTDLHRLIEQESPDALAILIPSEAHGAALEVALEQDLHVLCEKPLLWGGEAPGRRARDLWNAFRERGLLLRENCQWPEVLPCYLELHPDFSATDAREFGMRLSPARRGAQMIGDAMPHPLSLLQAVAPDAGADLEGIEFSSHAADCAELEVSFVYRTAERTIESRVRLVQGERLPREASLQFDGLEARRRVRLPDYRLSLAAGEREVPLPDPLVGLLGRFLQELREVLAGKTPRPDPAIPQRAQLLDKLMSRFIGGPP